MAEKESLGVTIIRTVEDMFEEFVTDFSDTFGSRGKRLLDSVRVTKSPNLVTVEIDVPGAAKEDVKVRCQPGRIKVEWTPRGRDKREREIGIGRSADIAAISAKVENGVLTLTVPAKAPSGEEREVSVG